MKFLYYIELMILLSSMIYVGFKIYPISKQIKIKDIDYDGLKKISRSNIDLITKELVKEFNLLGDDKRKVAISTGVFVVISLIMMIFGPVRYASDVYISTSQHHQIKLVKKQARQIKHGLNNHKDKNQMKKAHKAFNSLKETAMISDPTIDTKDTSRDITTRLTENAVTNIRNFGNRLVNGSQFYNQDKPEPKYSDGYMAVAAFNSAFEPGSSVGKAADYKKDLYSLVTLAGSAIISENNSTANIKAHNGELVKKLTSGI